MNIFIERKAFFVDGEVFVLLLFLWKFTNTIMQKMYVEKAFYFDKDLHKCLYFFLKSPSLNKCELLVAFAQTFLHFLVYLSYSFIY